MYKNPMNGGFLGLKLYLWAWYNTY